MNTALSIRVFVLVFLATLPQMLSAESSEPRITPKISLVSYDGDVKTIQSAQDPLLLQLTISNALAGSINRSNQRKQRLLEQATAPELENPLSEQELEEWAEEMTLEEVPTFSLGSDAVGLNDLLSFQIRNRTGQKIDIAPQLLRSYREPNSAKNFGLDDVYYALYALDSVDLAGLESGSYQIAVGLDTSEEASMWQGHAFSNVLELELHQSHPDPAWEGSSEQAQLFAHYLQENEEFDMALMHAHIWTIEHPDSTDAWSYLGDAYTSTGDPNKALESYYTALEKFRFKYGDFPRETPQLLVDSIDEIESAL